MGVGMRAYSRLEYVRPGPRKPDEYDDEDILHVFAYQGFDASVRGLANADVVTSIHGAPVIAQSIYRITPETDVFKVQGSSYSGYGVWRNLLSESVLGVPAKTVWNNPGEYMNQPFYEIINFADNEGCIGPEAAEELWRDFSDDDHRAKLDAATEDTFSNGWMMRLYDDLAVAFDVASDSGLVQFS